MPLHTDNYRISGLFFCYSLSKIKIGKYLGISLVHKQKSDYSQTWMREEKRITQTEHNCTPNQTPICSTRTTWMIGIASPSPYPWLLSVHLWGGSTVRTFAPVIPSIRSLVISTKWPTISWNCFNPDSGRMIEERSEPATCNHGAI